MLVLCMNCSQFCSEKKKLFTWIDSIRTQKIPKLNVGAISFNATPPTKSFQRDAKFQTQITIIFIEMRKVEYFLFYLQIKSELFKL